jgi:hypothetical protein
MRKIHFNGYKLKIEVGGNVSWKNLPNMRDAGAQVFAGDTSSIFERGGDLQKTFTYSARFWRAEYE